MSKTAKKSCHLFVFLRDNRQETSYYWFNIEIVLNIDTFNEVLRLFQKLVLCYVQIHGKTAVIINIVNGYLSQIDGTLVI